MFNRCGTAWLRWIGGRPCFRVYGKAHPEGAWRTIDVFATPRRNADSRWPRYLFRGTCITWTAGVIAVGRDFAECVLREQREWPASRERPVVVTGGRIRDAARRIAAGGSPGVSASEILAHECGHTWQALRMSWLYLPVGATVTLCREGPYWWNRFENRASELGQFGGIVNGSVHEDFAPLPGERWGSGGTP